MLQIEKNGQLESKLRELIQFGGENDSISEKLHRSTLALFSASDLETTLGILYQSLKDDFQMPHVALRLWGKVPEQSYLPELAATSQELRDYAAALGLLWRQDGRAITRFRPDGAKFALRITKSGGGRFSQEEIETRYQAIWRAEPNRGTEQSPNLDSPALGFTSRCSD